MTVLKAIKELQALGLVTRRVGSGTYIATQAAAASHVFGLLIPALGETEIFEAICQGMMLSPQAKMHSLLWGHSLSREGSQSEITAEKLCRQYIAQKVSGVFFAPIEHQEDRHATNRRLANMLERARIPIVLLDRCLEPFPRRSKYDLVAIDNHRVGYLATEHLLRAGAKRICFLARPNSAPTVEVRISGYRQALAATCKSLGEGMVWLGDPEDLTFIREILQKDRPDAFLCANDLTAGQLMHTLLALSQRIPEDVRLVGVDDVKYARLLPVPLTTVHQPCHQLGRMAMSVMLDRIADPDLPTRELLLSCELVVRKSCGG